jgi:iron(III) transport system permease protein
MARTSFAGKGFAEVLLLAPLILPPFVGALGFEAVLGRHGALNAVLVQAGLIGWDDPPDWLGSHRFAAVCLIESLHLYPFLYLTAAASISRLDPALIEAARISGASAWVRFTRIIIPCCGRESSPAASSSSCGPSPSWARR